MLVVQLVLIVIAAAASSSFGIIASMVIWRSHAVVIRTHVLMCAIPSSAAWWFTVRGRGGRDLTPLVRSGKEDLALDFHANKIDQHLPHNI